MNKHQLLKLCLSEYYFLYNNLIRMQQNLGCIALSIMVIYLNVAFKELSTYLTQALTFNMIFKKMQDLKLENNYYSFRHSEQSNYIDNIEFGNEMQQLNFFDVTITYITLTVINTATSKSFGKHH